MDNCLSSALFQDLRGNPLQKSPIEVTYLDNVLVRGKMEEHL